MSFLELKFSQRQRKLGLKISEKYTVRLLFKKIHNTVRHMNLPTVVLEKLHNLYKILHKLCNFSYTTVGRFICFIALCNFIKQWSNSVEVVYLERERGLKWWASEAKNDMRKGVLRAAHPRTTFQCE